MRGKKIKTAKEVQKDINNWMMCKETKTRSWKEGKYLEEKPEKGKQGNIKMDDRKEDKKEEIDRRKKT